MWWRYAEPAVGITWSSRMCSARHARLIRRGSHAAPGLRATAPARPVNNEGQQDQSAADNPNGSGADAGPTPSSGSPRRTSQRPAVPPDDRLTTILPPVKDEAPNRFRDPIEAVKAALDGRPSSQSADSLDMASAALDRKTSRRQEKPAGGSGGPPTGGPPGGRPPGPPGPPPGGAPPPAPRAR